MFIITWKTIVFKFKTKYHYRSNNGLAICKYDILLSCAICRCIYNVKKKEIITNYQKIINNTCYRFKNIGWIRLKYIFYYHIIAFLFILIGCSWELSDILDFKNTLFLSFQRVNERIYPLHVLHIPIYIMNPTICMYLVDGWAKFQIKVL